MKIALLASAKSPHTVKWANMFQKRGNTVTVFSLPEDKPETLEFDPGISINYLSVKAEDGIKKNAKELKAILSAGSYDVVNAIGADTYGFLAVYAKHKFLLTMSGYDLIDAEGAAKGIVLKAIKASAAVCCPSAVAMQRVQGLLKKKKKEITVAFPGINLAQFDIAEGTKEEGVVTFGCIKPLEELSGISEMLDAYKEMKGKTEAKTKLVIIGEGSLENQLKQKAAQLGIEFEVEFKGAVPHKDMPAEINKMNVLLNCAKKEIFGVPTIEAMACGVPTIATDTEGSSEIILNGVTGYTCKIGKTSAFAYRMQEFANYPQNAAKMGSKTRGDVEDYFEINAQTDKYIKALEFVKNA